MIESKLDPGRGPVVSMLIMRGTLKVGDALVAGAHWGRVRAMNDYRGERIKEATPGQPVEILGFDGVPEAGEHVRVVDNEREARSLAGDRAHRLKTEALARRQGVKLSLEDVFARAQQGDLAELALVVKADVAGSLEALADEVARLPQEEVKVALVREGVGGITEDDVMLASASDAIIIGFNVRPVGEARQVADREGVEIRTYSVIYKIVEELRDAMQGLLAPEEVEETVGTAEVRQTFRASRIGTIAGSYVTDGTIRRGAPVRIVRDGRVIYTGQIGIAAPLPGRRPRGPDRLRVRHHDRGLRGHQGRRRLRGASRRRQVERELVSVLVSFVCLDRDPPPLPGQPLPEGQAQGSDVAEGSSTAAVRRGRLGDRPPRPVAARDALGGARRRRRGRGRRGGRPSSSATSESQYPEASAASAGCSPVKKF